MKKTARPLSLRRETVRVLASSQLASAQGGDYTTLIIGRLTGDDNNASGCAICLLPPEPFPTSGSAGHPGGCATQILTQTRVIIRP
jgi:hypothetical protein